MSHRLRILFVGEIQSSHARAWIDLVDGDDLDICSFTTSRAPIAHDFPHQVTFTGRALPWESRRRVGLPGPVVDLLSALSLKTGSDLHALVGRHMLVRLLRRFRPHLVHAFGASVGGLAALTALDRAGLPVAPRLIVQARGGPDLVDGLAEADTRSSLRDLLRRCDLLICDNPANYELAAANGCEPERQFGNSICGSGGVTPPDRPPAPPSIRDRIVLIPKAYEGYQSKVLPVLAALELAWEAIAPARVVMTAVNEEAVKAVRRLPNHIRSRLECTGRVPREAVLAHMQTARVMLAPSLMDGVPNVLYEAMAAGAAPVVSPLPGITPLFESGRHLLFARNLYPDEIAAGLTRLMREDAMVDEMARCNREYVGRIANRGQIRRDVLTAYRRQFANRACDRRSRQG